VSKFGVIAIDSKMSKNNQSIWKNIMLIDHKSRVQKAMELKLARIHHELAN